MANTRTRIVSNILRPTELTTRDSNLVLVVRPDTFNYQRIAGKTGAAETVDGRYTADLSLRLPARLCPVPPHSGGKAEPDVVKEG